MAFRTNTDRETQKFHGPYLFLHTISLVIVSRNLLGGHAGDLFERAVEGGQAREPGIKRDVNDMHIRLAEHPLRAFDAFLGQKGHERRVGVAFEQVGKVGFAHAHLRGHILQRQRLGAGLRQVLFAKRVPVKQEVKPPVAVWLEQTVR